MSTPTSLEFLLQTLVNSPEEDKRSLTRSAIGLLREVCNMYTKSHYAKFQQTAESARHLLDQILLGKIGGEGADEEEFLESGDLPAAGSVQTPMTAQTAMSPTSLRELHSSASTEAQPSFVEQVISDTDTATATVAEEPTVAATASSNLHELVKTWNTKVEPWLQITIPPAEGLDAIRILLEVASALRSNLLSATLADDSNKEEVKRFEKYWRLWCQEIQRQGYEVSPNRFGRMDQAVGDVIYSCRPGLTQPEIALLVPGVKRRNETLVKPVSLVTMPSIVAWPADHPDRNLDPQWRAILGELDLLLKHIQIQHSVVCAIEGINKNRVETLAQCKETVIAEIIRRGDALRNELQDNKSIYRLATNFWRVMECFWAVFHDDDRPAGYSFFDRIRRRVQSWQTIIRQESQLYIRNFDSSHDSLSSVNKYIGNIILQSRQGIAPGSILRELRPAVIVKVNNVTRLLKGRVIAT